MDSLTFGILTVSDSCFKREKGDLSGPLLDSLVKSHFSSCEILYVDVVPDEVSAITEKLEKWCKEKCDVILTTGGTGLSSRDVTPEATKDFVEKIVPGVSHALMNASLNTTPFAMLSRAVCGIFNKTLIINLPGSPKAVVEQFNVLHPVLAHAVALIKDRVSHIQHDHEQMQRAKPSPSKVKLSTAENRARVSPYPMVEVDVAFQIIRTFCVQESKIELVDVIDALGRVLAEDVRALEPLPPFPASIKDGYAVRAEDGKGTRTLVDVAAAGDQPDTRKALAKGECVRISTGAPVPLGANAVVQIEDTAVVRMSDDLLHELEIDIHKVPKVGQDIRQIGSDVAMHSIVLRKGDILQAVELGLLATVGKHIVSVYKRLAVGVLSTGNELQDYKQLLKPGCIRDSNKITLISLLKQYGFKAKDLGIANDDPNAVKSKFTKAFNECDLIITSGGVSMGEFDIIKNVLEQDFEAVIQFGRVNLKPGKPTMFATCNYNGKIKIVFGLPGNPVSATVTCLLFVIPALRHSQNQPDPMFRSVEVIADFVPVADKERPEYHRVNLTYESDGVYATSTGNQISSRLNSCAGADGLMLVPPVSASQNLQTEDLRYKCYLLNY